MLLFSPLTDWLFANWELIVTVSTAIAAVVLGGLYIRQREKAGINQTHVETIDALNALLETREKECAAGERESAHLRDAIVDLESERDELARSNDDLRSEYKVVSSIVLTDLLAFWGERESHKLELENLKSEIRVLKMRLDRFELEASQEPNRRDI